MAFLQDLFGGENRQTSGQPAGGVYSAAPVGAPSPAGRNPFSGLTSRFASDAGGIPGLIGMLSGAPTGQEMQMQRVGGAQAQGLAGLQERIAQGMTPQQAVVDFVGSEEGQAFFGSSQDPIGAIKGYLQVSQPAAKEYQLASPGSTVFDPTTGQFGASAPTTEGQNVDKFLGLAQLNPQEVRDVGRAMLTKMSEGTGATQKEDAIRDLVAKGIIDETTGQKWLAGVIQIQQPRDATGAPIGAPVAIDASEMLKTGNPSDIKVVIVGGKNGAAGNLPDTGREPDPVTGEVPAVKGDIIFGAGIVGAAAETAGGILGNINPNLAAPEYTQYRTALETINADVANLLNVNKTLASEMKIYSNMVDKKGFTSNPIAQGEALMNLLNVVDRRIAYNTALMASTDPKIATSDNKSKASAELAALGKIKQDMPDRASLIEAMVRAQQGEGTIQEGIKQGAEKIGEIGKGVEEVGKAASEAAGGQTPVEGAGTPKVFKNAQDAAAAADRGEISEGDTITIDGKQVVVKRKGK